jgi:hypothetical protein
VSEVPKLNGWITPEYAEQMVMDLLIFLKKNHKEGSIFDLAYRGLVTRKCLSMTTNAHSVI